MSAGKRQPLFAPALVAFVAGVFLWLGASFASGRREPWDSAAYWMGAYPVATGLCIALALFFPARPWLWAFALFAGQFVGMILRNGEAGGLWPLGLAMFAVLALPGAFLGSLVAKLRRPKPPAEPPPPAP